MKEKELKLFQQEMDFCTRLPLPFQFLLVQQLLLPGFVAMVVFCVPEFYMHS